MGKRLAAMLSGLCVLVLLVFVAPPANAAIVVDTVSGTDLLADINSARASILNNHAFMTSLAEKHSVAMAKQVRLGHFGFSNRVAKIYASDAGISGNFICENVAYVRGAGFTSASAADALFNAWMHSPPHKKCMLDQDGHTTQSAGIGVARRRNTWWATFIAAHDTTP